MDNLKDYIKQLVDIEKEEEKYKIIFSNLKKEKNILNDNIMNIMEKNSITEKDIIFGDKKIKYATSNVQDGVTKKLILERLTIFLKNESTANDATNFIYSKRNVEQKKFIKISDIKANEKKNYESS